MPISMLRVEIRRGDHTHRVTENFLPSNPSVPRLSVVRHAMVKTCYRKVFFSNIFWSTRSNTVWNNVRITTRIYECSRMPTAGTSPVVTVA